MSSIGEFRISNSDTSTIDIQGVISGTGKINIVFGDASSVVILSGAASNTYVGDFDILSGTLNLNKTAATAITGDLLVGATRTAIVSQTGQFGGASSTSNIRLLGDLDISAAPESIGSLDFESAGTLTQGGNTLTLVDTPTNALIMQGGATIAGPLVISGSSGGAMQAGINFDSSNDGTAIISGAFSLGGDTRTFDVEDGSASIDMQLTGILSSGGITKTGAGTLELSGSVANTISDPTTVTDGTLAMNMSSGNAFASTTVTVSGGTLRWDGSDQVPDGTTVNVTNAGLAFSAALSDTITTLSLDSSTSTKSGATLSTLTFTGATLTNTNSFSVSNGSGELSLSGPISGAGSLSKSGPGTLEIAGSSVNTFSGTTTVTNGTLALNKSVGDAVGSTLVSLTGGTVRLDGSDQIPDIADVSVTNATFETTGTVTDTIDMLAFDGSDFLKQDAGQSTLTFTSSSLSNSNTITPSDGSAIIDLSGPLAGAGDLTILGSGSARFSGSSDNTYTGSITLTSGDLQLNKDTAITGSSGTIAINGSTTLQMLSNADQIITPLSVTIGASGATLDLNSLDTTAGSLLFNAGTLSYGAAEILTLNTTDATALSMRDVTIAGNVTLSGASGGGILFDIINGNTALISGDLDLGIAQRVFTVEQGGATPDMLLTGDLLGSSGFIKTGAGTLEVSSGGINSYTGPVEVQQGELFLDGAGLNGDIRGDLTVNGGTVFLGSSNRIIDSSNVTVSSGVFNMNMQDETVSSLTFTGGMFIQSSGELTLTSTSTALTMRDTTLDGKVILTGGSGGDVVFDSTNNGTASVAEIDLGAVDRTINVGTGTEEIDMIFNGGSSTGGGLIKTGAGTLQLNSLHAYMGPMSVSSGTVQVEGMFSAPSVSVSSGATLKGSGTITSDLSIDGTFAPGSSIGTTFVVGSATFISTSTFEVEHDLTTSDLLDVSGAPGTVTIDPGASLSVITEPGLYPPSTTYTIITTTGGVIGNFSSISGSAPTFIYSTQISGSDLLLTVVREPLPVIVPNGNASKVAMCLNDIEAPAGSDIRDILIELECSCAASELSAILDQMQPSQLKGLALSQENNTFKMQNIRKQRTREITRRICLDEPVKEKKISIWGDIFGDYYRQDKDSDEVAFRAATGGAAVGINCQGIDNYLIGFFAGYTYSDVKWRENRGDGDINSVYGSLYSTFFGDAYSIDVAILGAFNHYNETRKLEISFLDRKAQSNFNGGEGALHLGGGYIMTNWDTEFKPFVSLDGIYLYQQSFEETGAGALNLDVDSSDYAMFRSELGIQVSRCINKAKSKLLFDGKLSWIREERFFGANYSASFKGEDCTFKVKGLNPDRSLFSPAITGTYMNENGNKIVSVSYEAEIGGHILDQNVSLQGVYKF